MSTSNRAEESNSPEQTGQAVPAWIARLGGPRVVIAGGLVLLIALVLGIGQMLFFGGGEPTSPNDEATQATAAGDDHDQWLRTSDAAPDGDSADPAVDGSSAAEPLEASAGTSPSSDGTAVARASITARVRAAMDGPVEHDGLALAWNDVVVRAPDAGFIASLNIEEGTRAGKGSLIAKMDDRLQRVAAEAARMQADSDLEVQSAYMTLLLDEVEVDKLQQVFDRGAGSEWELRQATFERDISVLRLDLAREERKQAQLTAEAEQHRLDLLWMRAPFDCYVERIAVEPGEYVERGDEIIRLVALDTLRVELQLPAAMFGRVEMGRTYTLRAGAPVSGPVRATLRHASRVIDPASGTFRCVFEIDNEGWRLPSGFTVWFSEADAGV